MSDKESKTAVPLEFMDREVFGIDLIADSMQKHISSFNLGGCIVGYRYIRSIEKSEGVSEQIFIDNLCKTVKLESLKYAYWDGRIISKDVDIVLKHHAEYLVDQLGLPQETLETILDKLAAVRTLQGYMDCANMLVAIDNLALGN
ncbi:hypothetical protein Q3G72_011572 [Acer saccharum]|nr:hypothetical protein Q3G72_011572 [Acer saccharum]